MQLGPIAITGAGGFVGGALLRHLTRLGWPVLAISRQPIRDPAGASAFPISSYEDVSSLRSAFEGQDAVVHLAALAHARPAAGAFSANVRSAQAVARAAVEAGVRRLVFVSSIGVNGLQTNGVPFTETTAPAPVEPYSRSKLEAERAMSIVTATTATQLVIVRPPLVHGPGAPGNFGSLCRLVARGVPMPFGAIRNRRSLIGLDNLVDLLALCVQHPAAAGELFLVADGEDVCTPDLIRRIARAQGRPARLLDVPLPLVRLAATLVGQGPAVDRLAWSLQVDARKARAVLGWHPPVSLSEGLARAAAQHPGLAR